MELKYTIIRTKSHYKQYCNKLEELVFSSTKTKNIKEEIDLLTLLIEKWDNDHNTFRELDPIKLLQSLMKDHNLKAKDLVALLEVSKGYVSDILNYKKGLSKDVIRKLSERFKVSQEAFNRHYELVVSENSRPGKSRSRNHKKQVAST